MQVFGQSDIGKVRSNNEDSFRYGKLSDSTIWAVVCDGMGGAEGGEVASSIAVDIIAEKIQLCYNPKLTETGLVNLLSSAIVTANVAVFDKAEEEKNLEGMGTTVVAAVIQGTNAVIAHVGDSRAYVFSKNDTKLKTIDHSLVQQMIDSGQMTSGEAKSSPLKNIILKCLGTSDEVPSDFVEFDKIELSENDAILLCSDGLSGFVDEKNLRKTIFSSKSPEAAVDVLVSSANKAGGGDNITVVLIK